MTAKTISWFGSTIEQSESSRSRQYAIVASETIDPELSSSELVTGVVTVLIDVIEPAAGQTTLTLYEYVNPDTLEDIVTASAEKKSDVEVRFTVEAHLVTVRSAIPSSSTNRLEHSAVLVEDSCPSSCSAERFKLCGVFTTLSLTNEAVLVIPSCNP